MISPEVGVAASAERAAVRPQGRSRGRARGRPGNAGRAAGADACRLMEAVAMRRGRAYDIAMVGMACRFPGAADLFALLGEHPGQPGHDARGARRPLGTRRVLRSRTRAPTTAWPAGAAAISTRRSPSTRPRTGSCRWRSREVSPSSSWSSMPPWPRWPTRPGPGPPRRRARRGGHRPGKLLQPREPDPAPARPDRRPDASGLLAALHPEWTDRGTRAAPPT